MGMDAKNVQVCIWRILKMFMSICFRFVQAYPFVSGISPFFIFLYTNYPSIFKILIYSSPVLVCTIVYLRFLLNSEQSKTRNLEKDEKKNHGLSSNRVGLVEDDVVVERNENSYVQKRVRRNVKENNRDLDDLISQTVSIDEKLKESQEEKTSSSLSHNGSNDWSRKGFGSVADLGALNLEEAEYEDEEETQEDRNKAVEWTEDDQQNLMDLGTSEIERNKRLESLIAKRRARKTLSMQVQRNLIDLDSGPPPSQIAPILIARNNHLDFPWKFNDPEVLPMPGSAPSVLLPMKSPFDLPYDPLEEKPNLTGDTFQQEFMPVQKDLCFCRHGSFSLGPSFLGENKQDWHDLNPFFAFERRASEGPIFSRFRRQSDDNLVEQVLSLECESLPPSGSARVNDNVEQEGHLFEQVVNSENAHDMDSRSADCSEVHTRPGLVIENNGSLNPSSSSSWEANENLSAKKHGVAENLESRMGDFPWALTNSFPKNMAIEIENIGQTSEPFYDSSTSGSGNARMEEQLFYQERIARHAPSFSIASDMQVEVSEGGSPPLTSSTVSSTDGESLTYDGDVDKEITSGTEEMWGDSSHLSGIEENESSSRAVHEICEEDVIGVGFSGINQESKHSITPLMLRATTSTSSFSSPRTERQEEGDVQKIRDEVHQDVREEIEEPVSSASPRELFHQTLTLHVPQEAQNLDHPSGDDALKNSEETSSSVNLIQNLGNLVLTVNRDTESLQYVEDKAGEAQPSIMHKTDKVMSESADEVGSKLIEYIEKNYEEPIMESHKLAKKKDNSESNKEFDEQFDELTQYESIVDESKLTEDRKNLTSTQDSEGTQSTVENEISGMNLNSDDSAITFLLPEIVVKQIVFNSSPPSSPKSVLPENVFKDQDPLSSFDHMIQVDVQHSTLEDSSLLETSPENLVQDKEGNDNLRSVEDIEGESINISGNSPSTEVLKPAEEVLASSAEAAKEKSEKVAECDAAFTPSCPTNKNNNINIFVTIGSEEGSSNSPWKLPEKANIIYSTSDFVACEKEEHLNSNSVEVGETHNESMPGHKCSGRNS